MTSSQNRPGRRAIPGRPSARDARRNRWQTVLALLLVPLLVAGGFLWGTTRTDSGLRGVQAAIVNNDEMVTVNGQAMPLGRQLSAELVDSEREQNFTWVLASPEKAAEGLKSGRYAAVVTIPKEFSAAASSFSKPPSEAVQATIHVETSPVAGISEVALGRSIAGAATNALNRFLTGEYLKNIYVGFNEMAAQMLEMVDGTRQLADGAGQLADGAGQSADGAGALADGLDLASAGSPQLRDGAAQSATGAQALADGLGMASAGSAQLRVGVQQAASGAGQLADGAGQLADGTRQWAEGADTYADGVDTYATGVEQYADGVTQYTGAVNGLLVPVRDGLDRIPEWAGWLADAEKAVTGLTGQAIDFDARVQAAIGEVRTYVETAMAMAQGTDAVSAGVTALDAKAAALASGTGMACPDDLDEDACAAFQQGVAEAGAALAQVSDGVQDDAVDLVADATAVTRAGDAVLAVLDRLSQASTELVAWAPRVQADLQQLDSQVPEGTPRTKAEVVALLEEFIGAGDRLDEGGRQLASGADALGAGARQLAGGARGLADGTDEFATGASGLADGMRQLSAGVSAYTGGVDQAATGAQQLAGGLGQLSDGVDAYTSGIDQAASGAQLLAGGLDQLAGGAGDLADGTDQLADGVAEGADAIPTYTEAERDQLSEVVASPVSTDGLEVLTRPSLAWVSLLLVTALWVGALATFAVVPGVDRRAALSTAANGRLMARALLPGLGIVAAQAVLLAVLGAVALRLSAGEGALLTAVLLVAGAVFGLVNHALAALFGNGGRIASVVMAVVTAVTATTSTAPALFGALRGLSPLSPALDGVRAVETTGQVAVPLFILAGWGIVALAAAVAAVSRTRMVRLDEVVRSAPASPRP